MIKQGCFWTLVGLSFLSSVVVAQERELVLVPMQMKASRPVSVSFSGGPARFNALKPSSDIQLEPGNQFRLELEKPMGGTALSLITDLTFSKTRGKAHYYYQSYRSTYDLNDVPVTANSYDLAIGVKWKPIQFYRVSPYIQGGAVGGFFQMIYDRLADAGADDVGSDYLNSEGVLQVGTFAEIGLEFAFSNEWGMSLSNRYTDMSTRPLDTLKNQGVRYAHNVYSLGMFVHF